MQNCAFGDYTLSDYALHKLAEIKKNPHNNFENVKLWENIVQEVNENNTREIDNQMDISGNEDFSNVIASQFYFSQPFNDSINIKESTVPTVTKVQDIEKLLHESLELTHGNFDLNLLKSLSNSELVETLEILSNHLSTTGLLNTLKSMCDFTDEQRMKYFDVICTKLILYKLCDVDKVERNIINVIKTLTQKFPEEVRKLIYIPMLNCDLNDNDIILNIAQAIGAQKKDIILSDYTSHANEIKECHFPLIEFLISSPLNDSTKSELIKMFLDKCTVFSKNNFFGKLITTFINSCDLFTDTEINILKEIAIVHKSPMKRAIDRAIKKL